MQVLFASLAIASGEFQRPKPALILYRFRYVININWQVGVKPSNVNDEMIDEILVLKGLEESAMGKFLKKSITQKQQKRLWDVSGSFNLILR